MTQNSNRAHMTPWQIHEAILEDIDERSSMIMPSQIEFSPGRHIPPGVYAPNDEGIWLKIEEYVERERNWTPYRLEDR